MSISSNTDAGPLPAAAVALMLLLCACWGLNLVAAKVGNAGIPPVLQAGLRSAVAATLLWLWCRARGMRLETGGTLLPGLSIGFMFALEFLLIFEGLRHTSAGRGVVFLYSAPFFVAAGAHWLLPDDRLTRWKLAGLVTAFGGLVVAFLGGEQAAGDTWLGDLMLLGGGFFWGATTVVVKASSLRRARPELVLQYQLLTSALLLLPAAPLLGEPLAVRLTPLVTAAFLYQAVGVAFVSYSAWFWLVSRHPASRLSAFSFLTPLFGVAAGALLLEETVRPGFLLGVTLVAVGLWLVNRAPGAALQRGEAQELPDIRANTALAEAKSRNTRQSL